MAEGTKDAEPTSRWTVRDGQTVQIWTCPVYPTLDGRRLVVGPVSDQNIPYEGSYWLKLYQTHGRGTLPDALLRTYSRLLALRSRVELERSRGLVGPLVPLADLERELSQREIEQSRTDNDTTVTPVSAQGRGDGCD